MFALACTRLADLVLPGILLPSRNTGYSCTPLPHSAWASNPYRCTANALPAESFFSLALERLKREGRRNPRGVGPETAEGHSRDRDSLCCPSPAQAFVGEEPVLLGVLGRQFLLM